MMRGILVALLLSVLTCVAQEPTYTRPYGLTISYEDFSDILRRFPGMYPYDYGSLGSPVIFRPWGLNPWEMRYYKDGILQNRISDGLYDSNLQPVSELDSVRYDLLKGDAAGQIDMWTRTIPADSPYTELQIREGFYNYGTVDLAHGQRLYKNSSLELTGRLVWYDGLRPETSSKFNRLRARVAVPLGKQWTSRWTYAGSSVDFNSPIRIGGGYTEREEFIAHAVKDDTLANRVRPEFNLFWRRDRENWGSEFRLRESVVGWTAGISRRVGKNAWWVRNEGYLADISYPKAEYHDDSRVELRVGDSISVSRFTLSIESALRHEARVAKADHDDHFWKEGSIRASYSASRILTVFGGLGLSEQRPPEAWYHAEYHLADRPLMISRAFADTILVLSQDHILPVGSFIERDDRYIKGELGVSITGEPGHVAISGLVLSAIDDKFSSFVPLTENIALIQFRDDKEAAKFGGTIQSGISLYKGLEVQGNWFVQSDPKDINRVMEQRGYSRLYFERNFFTAPLTIRSHISYEHIGTRMGYSDKAPEGAVLRPAHVVGFRLAATIHGVTLIWGTENFLKEHYSLMPGYPMIGKEEYLGFQWRLWL